MELETRVIHKNRTPISAFSQMVTEEDYNLPEYKPDIMAIIKSRGTISVEEIVPEDDHVMMQGKLTFEVLYQGEGAHPVIDFIKGSMPFRERVNVEGLQATDHVVVSTNVEDMGVVVINSRKLSLRGLTDIHVTVTGSEEAEFPVASTYPPAYQIRREEHTVLKLLEQKRDRMRFKQEISLPKEKDTIQTVLWQDVHLEQTSMRQMGDGIELSAMMCVFVLYRSEKDEVTWHETCIPVTDHVNCDIPGTDGFYQMKLVSVQTSVEAREDLDGEMRNLAAECFADVEATVWQEEKIELLQDAYCMTGELHMHRHREDVWQMAMKNEAQLTGEVNQPLPDTKEALFLCHGHGEVQLQEVKSVAGSIHVAGVCYGEVLYLTTEEAVPFSCAKISIPFSGEIEAGSIQEGDYIDVDASLNRFQCSLVDSGNIHCRGEISLQLMAFHKEEIMVPDDVVEEPLDLDALQRQPGMIGYVVKKGDILWDIAKRFHTTQQELMETNELSGEDLSPGQKLLIMKHIYL